MIESFSIDPVVLPVKSTLITLTGSKDPTVATIIVNDDEDGATYPTPSSWSYDLQLSPGENNISIQAEDVALNRTDELAIVITLPEIVPTIYNPHNALDDKGLEVGLTRLPGEKLLYFKNRVLDAEENLGNTTYEGLMRAVSRELSLDIVEDVFTITPIEDSVSRVLRAGDSFVTIEPTRLLLEAPALKKQNEKVVVDPGTLKADLAEIPTSKEDVSIQTIDGHIFKQSDFEIIDEKTLRIRGGSRFLLVSYTYLESIDISSSTTLANLETSIEAILGVAGTALYTCTVAAGYTSSKANRLVRPTRSAIPRAGLDLDLAQIQLTELGNKQYRDSLLNSFGTYIDTKLQVFAETTRSKGRIFLKETILDRDSLLEYGQEEELAALPHLFDPNLRYHTCDDPTDANRYSELTSLRGPALCPNHPTKALNPKGVRKVDLQSGPGQDLRMVDIV